MLFCFHWRGGACQPGLFWRPFMDGDRINLGAWTALTVHRG